MTSTERAFRGIKNDWRLHALSVFSVAVAFVCLAASLLIVVNVNMVRERWASTGRVSVFLKKDVTREQVSVLERALRDSDGVLEVRFMSSEDARREVTGQASDPVLDALPSEAFPASLEVTVHSAVGSGRLEKMATQLGGLPEVERVETYGAWSERLAAVLTSGVTAAALLAVIVLAAVVSVVSSTIRLALQRRRIEVEVLKLVGATDAYVRRPFVIEGAAQGALGALLAVVLVALLFAIVRTNLDGGLGTLLGMTPSFLPLSAILVLIVSGAALGALAAFLSLRKLLIV